MLPHTQTTDAQTSRYFSRANRNQHAPSAASLLFTELFVGTSGRHLVQHVVSCRRRKTRLPYLLSQWCGFVKARGYILPSFAANSQPPRYDQHVLVSARSDHLVQTITFVSARSYLHVHNCSFFGSTGSLLALWTCSVWSLCLVAPFGAPSVLVDRQKVSKPCSNEQTTTALQQSYLLQTS